MLENKTVIITGGSRGIGKACVLAFAKAKANIAFTYNQSEEAAQRVAAEAAKLGSNCLVLQADIKDYQQCRKVITQTLEKFGQLDILLNNAGIARDKALMMMELSDWQEVIDTNLNGTFNMTRAAITTLLKQKKGCIINMSSVSGLVGIARQTNYCAAKAGIIGFSRSLAKEVAGYGVRVNTVCPGYTDTEMVSVLQDKVKDEILKTIPVKRLASPNEVADLCVYLASDQASYITGEVIKIDGGLTA